MAHTPFESQQLPSPAATFFDLRPATSHPCKALEPLTPKSERNLPMPRVLRSLAGLAARVNFWTWAACKGFRFGGLKAFFLVCRQDSLIC